MEVKTGSVSIHAQNIMPIIKKWLYSDKDIFIRELVSNACDAITKYKFISPGDAAGDEMLHARVIVDEKNNQLKFVDNGVGMTHDEVERYINQVAFSSATEFLEKYKGGTGDSGGIIGHFGLGFYSAFMVAEKVTIDTLSWESGAAPVKWESSDGMEYTMSAGGRTARGTEITLQLNKEDSEFLKGYRVREVLDKYCAFMNTPIYLDDLSVEKKEDEEQSPINTIAPLWLKTPKDCTEEEYKEFYKAAFHEYEDPLFWIHLNIDYPFNLKGILYFPKLRREFGGIEGQIKLFSGQVFIAENIKELIPEFLMLLKGVLECPDLPLNVSRSFLQNDGYVKRLSAHITRKVADRLQSLYDTQREDYNKYWDDIHPFVKFGCMRDDKFNERVKDIVLFKTSEGEYLTLNDYTRRNGEKAENKLYYTSDVQLQAAAIAALREQEIDVAVLDAAIDLNYISFIEMQNKDLKAVRVDSDIASMTVDSQADEQLKTSLETLFREELNDQKLKVELKAFKDAQLPAVLIEDEQARRFKDLSKLYGEQFALPDDFTLTLNQDNAIVKWLADNQAQTSAGMVARHVFDLANMTRQPLDGQAMQDFILRNYKLLAALIDQ